MKYNDQIISIRVNNSIGEPFTDTVILFSRDRTMGRAKADSRVWFIISEPSQESISVFEKNHKTSMVRGRRPVSFISTDRTDFKMLKAHRTTVFKLFS